MGLSLWRHSFRRWRPTALPSHVGWASWLAPKGWSQAGVTDSASLLRWAHQWHFDSHSLSSGCWFWGQWASALSAARGGGLRGNCERGTKVSGQQPGDWATWQVGLLTPPSLQMTAVLNGSLVATSWETPSQNHPIKPLPCLDHKYW